MRQKTVIILFLLLVVIPRINTKTVSGQAAAPQVLILSADGKELFQLVDGDEVRLRLVLVEKLTTSLEVVFTLNGSDATLASCTIPEGGDRCESGLLESLGWYWDRDGNLKARQTVVASISGFPAVSSSELEVMPRPVVMVHGFNSNWEAWANYLGPDGYLASIGLNGYAVGDGQVPGVMNTGILDQPNLRTNTIAENAAILGEYIANVKTTTGAQKVDLLAHSMGGLISRYYIDRVMGEDDVAQLIMLGSPMAGTDCADLPAALGLYLPATLEIRPAYIQGVFNQQITHRKGIQFHALAGDSLVQQIQSPCTPVPSDLVVSKESVEAIPVHLSEMPVLHTELNTSQDVFEQYVKGRLQTPVGGFAKESDPVAEDAMLQALQFTRVYTGHLEQGGKQVLSIQIDPGVTVASFALFDSSHSLDVSVQGASGNVIELDPVKNGLIKVQDPSSLLYLGYGFNEPKPGAWVVTLLTTDLTPPTGADYALTATYTGGASLEAKTNKLLPQHGEVVDVNASLKLGEQDLPIENARAQVREPDGNTFVLDMEVGEHGAQTTWKPEQIGLYDVQVVVTGRLPDDAIVERTGFLVVQVQPAPELLAGRGTLALILASLIVVGSLVLIVFAIVLYRKWRRIRV